MTSTLAARSSLADALQSSQAKDLSEDMRIAAIWIDEGTIKPPNTQDQFLGLATLLQHVRSPLDERRSAAHEAMVHAMCAKRATELEQHLPQYMQNRHQRADLEVDA